jgi:hypothetical protein
MKTVSIPKVAKPPESRVLELIEEHLGAHLTDDEREVYLPDYPAFLSATEALIGDSSKSSNKAYLKSDIQELAEYIESTRRRRVDKERREKEAENGAETRWRAAESPPCPLTPGSQDKEDDPEDVISVPTSDIANSLHRAWYEFIERDLGRQAEIRDLRERIAKIGWLPDGAAWGEWETINFLESPIPQHLTFSTLEGVRSDVGVPLSKLSWRFHPTKTRRARREIILLYEGPQAIIWKKTFPIPERNEKPLLYRPDAPHRFHWGEFRRVTLESKWVGPIAFPEPVYEVRTETPYPGSKQDVFNVGEVKMGYEGTPVGEILRIGADIASKYCVSGEDAMQFLLSGHFPRRNVIEEQTVTCPIYDKQGDLEYVAYGPAHLSIPRWVPAKYVAERFEVLQQIAHIWSDPTNPHNMYKTKVLAERSEAIRQERPPNTDAIPRPDRKEQRYCPPDEQTVELVCFRLTRENTGESYTETLKAFRKHLLDTEPGWAKRVPLGRSTVPNSIQRVRRILFPYHRFASRTLWNQAVSEAIRIEEARTSGEQKRGRKPRLPRSNVD